MHSNVFLQTFTKLIGNVSQSSENIPC